MFLKNCYFDYERIFYIVMILLGLHLGKIRHRPIFHSFNIKTLSEVLRLLKVPRELSDALCDQFYWHHIIPPRDQAWYDPNFAFITLRSFATVLRREAEREKLWRFSLQASVEQTFNKSKSSLVNNSTSVSFDLSSQSGVDEYVVREEHVCGKVYEFEEHKSLG